MPKYLVRRICEHVIEEEDDIEASIAVRHMALADFDVVEYEIEELSE